MGRHSRAVYRYDRVQVMLGRQDTGILWRTHEPGRFEGLVEDRMRSRAGLLWNSRAHDM